MILLKSTKSSVASDADYVFEHVDDYFKVLPYLYSKLEGTWDVYVLVDSIRDVRRIYNSPPPEDVTVSVLTDTANIEQYLMEKPATKVESLSPYEHYLELFKSITDVTFDPKAVSEIYKRAGPVYENLEKALKEVMQIAEGTVITVSDVDKVLLSNNRVYSSDIMRAFLRIRDCKWRWKLVDRFIEDLGQDWAYYSLRKYVYQLLANKNKYLLNEAVAERFQKDVEVVDALTVVHAYQLFMNYTKPPLIRVILLELERRNLKDVSVHT